MPVIIMVVLEVARRWKSRNGEDFVEDILKPALSYAGGGTVIMLLITALRKGLIPQKVVDRLLGLDDEEMDELIREIASSLRNVL